jgi:hypothetical protein
MVGCRLATLNAVVVPFAREYRKFPVNSLLAGNSAFRDGFARDCLLQRRVVCEPEETTSTFWCRVPPRFKAYLEADRAEEAQRLLSARRPGASGVPCRGARLGAVSEHTYSAVAEYVSFDWISPSSPIRPAVLRFSQGK